MMVSWRYSLYGLILKTDLEFFQLSKYDGAGEADVNIMKKAFPQSIVDEKKCQSLIGMKRSYLINSTCRLLVENGNRITYELLQGGNPVYLRTYILGWGMAMLAFQRQTVAIHCSAVADDSGAILLCGESGAGKSTITTHFLNNGYRLMADDMAYVQMQSDGRAYAYPAFPYQKLCRNEAMATGRDMAEMIYIDETKDKFLVPYKGNFSMKPAAVKGMIMLVAGSGTEVMSQEVKGIAKFHSVVCNLFLRHLMGDKKYDPLIGALCLPIAGAVEMAVIARPQERNTVETVCNKAMQYAKQWSK